MGNGHSKWLSDFLCCVRGKELVAEPKIDGNVKFVFPTLASVMNSKFGPSLYGTIFCRSKDWLSPSFPRHLFHQCISQPVPGRPLHTKLMIASEASDKILYYYLGSANFTPSAWGRFVKEQSQLMVCNFELGVLLDPVDCPPSWPYTRPADLYASNDQPWMQDKFMQ